MTEYVRLSSEYCSFTFKICFIFIHLPIPFLAFQVKHLKFIPILFLYNFFLRYSFLIKERSNACIWGWLEPCRIYVVNWQNRRFYHEEAIICIKYWLNLILLTLAKIRRKVSLANALSMRSSSIYIFCMHVLYST